MNNKNQLIQLYGDDAIERFNEEIIEIAKNSNIDFGDEKFVELGISFTLINAMEILKGKQKHIGLKQLMTKSFGEAAMYKYNVRGGNL